MNEKHDIIIREAYKNYEPPFDVVSTVNRLLNGVPRNRLTGLKTVVVSSSQNLGKKVRHAKAKARGKSYELGKCRGAYNQKQQNKPALIEIWVDNTLQHWPRGCFHFSIFRDFALSEVLFHEIGHHIHYTQAPEYKEKEDVADKWESRLNRHYYRRQYWFLVPFFSILWLIVKPIKLLIKRRKTKPTTD